MENGKHIRLCFPISLDVFRELLDSILDVVRLGCAFVPKKPESGAQTSIHTAKELIQMVITLLGAITDDGPYELVDVSAHNAKVQIKIR